MHSSVVVFAVLVASVLAAPVDESQKATILAYENDNIGIDGYNFHFATSDGVERSESAVVKNIGTKDQALSVRGEVTWIDYDGLKFTLTFLADEKGFQPKGDHLPTQQH